MAVMGHVFPRPLAPEYAWAQVVKVMDSTCELDITTDDAIEVLGDAINQYVQWHRRDIILQGCPSQELQPRPEANIEHTALSPIPEGNNREEDQTTPAGNDRVDDFHRMIQHHQSHIYQKLTMRPSDPSCHHRNHHPRSQKCHHCKPNKICWKYLV